MDHNLAQDILDNQRLINGLLIKRIIKYIEYYIELGMHYYVKLYTEQIMNYK